MRFMKIYILPLVLCVLCLDLVLAESSYGDLVRDVSKLSGSSISQTEEIIETTFSELTNRMMENKGTSIPNFGRFYVQEKFDKSDRGNRKSTLTPRFSYSPEVKKALKER